MGTVGRGSVGGSVGVLVMIHVTFRRLGMRRRVCVRCVIKSYVGCVLSGVCGCGGGERLSD